MSLRALIRLGGLMLGLILAVVGADEWPGQRVETVIQLTETFLADLGLNLELPAVRTLTRHLIRILADSARATGHDFAFTDLYAIGQSTQTLRAFLADLERVAGKLSDEARRSMAYLAGQLAETEGYVRVVTTLSMLRTVLSPLRSGAVHLLCRPPFLNVGQALSRPGLLLAPLTNADFAEHNRFLAAMLRLALDRARAANPELRLALHLYDPRRYLPDGGRRWWDAAQADPQLSLLLDDRDPGSDRHFSRKTEEAGGIVFRCSEDLAAALIGDWGLDYTAAELRDLPEGAALARLPGLPAPVTLRVEP